MSNRFTLPVVLTCSAHAVLLFGFKSPTLPPDTEPIAPASKITVCTFPDVVEKPKDEDPATPVSEAAAGKRRVEPLASPEIYPREILPDDILIEGMRSEARPVKVPINVIPNGPGSWDGDPNSEVAGPGDGLAGLVYNPMNLDDTPRARVRTAPAYPFSLKTSGISGEVFVEFVVDEDGRVLNPRIVRSSHPDFNEPTLSAVARWRFEPGTRNMKPVRFRMAVPVTFSLNEK